MSAVEGERLRRIFVSRSSGEGPTSQEFGPLEVPVELFDPTSIEAGRSHLLVLDSSSCSFTVR